MLPYIDHDLNANKIQCEFSIMHIYSTASLLVIKEHSGQCGLISAVKY